MPDQRWIVWRDEMTSKELRHMKRFIRNSRKSEEKKVQPSKSVTVTAPCIGISSR